MRAALAMAMLFLPATIELRAADQLLTMGYGGLTRQYQLHTPPKLSAAAPLVFSLHGYTGSYREMVAKGMDSIADAQGFAVCYPQGSPDNGGKTHWNADLRISNVDDVGFLSKLARNLQAQYGFNPAYTFVSGFSNGGFMSYTLASRAPDVFRAAAPVSGLMSADTWKGFASTTPVPICHIHGLADPVVPVDGSMNPAGGWGGGPRVDTLEAFWTRFNHCTALDTAFLKPKAHARYHRDGIGGNEVWYVRIDGLDHNWPRSTDGINASAVIWDFFSRKIAIATRLEAHGNPARAQVGLSPFGPMERFLVNGARAANRSSFPIVPR